MTDDDPPAPSSLGDLLDALENAASGPHVSTRDILNQIGERSYTPIILAFAVLLVSPLSGIPGVPTLSAILMVMISVQGVIGRQQLWLPGFILRRRVNADRFRKAVSWLRKPGAWIDRHSHPRLRGLTTGPARGVAFLLCMIIPILWPALELLPMVTSIGAGAVALLAFGLLTHDGLYVLLGYLMAGGLAGILVWLT